MQVAPQELPLVHLLAPFELFTLEFVGEKVLAEKAAGLLGPEDVFSMFLSYAAAILSAVEAKSNQRYLLVI
jgi:hypothetical protein